jgi:hypothetical protein
MPPFNTSNACCGMQYQTTMPCFYRRYTTPQITPVLGINLLIYKVLYANLSITAMFF